MTTRRRGRPLGSVHDEKTRLKIQTTQIVKRLKSHIDGDVEMSSTQVRAAEILLNKTLPNLASVESIVETRNETVKTVSDEQLADIATTGSNGAVKPKNGEEKIH